MLANRPILLKALIGAGAFALVFAAGAAMLTSGVFGFGTGPQPQTEARAAPIEVAHQPWRAPEADFALAPEADFALAPKADENADEAAETEEPLFASTYGQEDLEGDVSGGEVGDGYDHRSEEALRDAQRQIALWREEERARQSEGAYGNTQNYVEPTPRTAPNKKPRGGGF